MKDANEREKVKSINFPRGKLTWIWVEEATELLESDVDILDDRLRVILDNPNLYYQMTLTFNQYLRRTGSSGNSLITKTRTFSHATRHTSKTALSMRHTIAG